MAINRLAESESIGLFTKAINPWHLCYNCYTSLLWLELHSGTVPYCKRWEAGRGPGNEASIQGRQGR